MNSLGAPGLDSFPTQFYQQHWTTVHNEVCQFVFDVVNQKISQHDANQTFIALIPKCKHPIKLEDFMPFSLCKVVYKIVVKLLANLLKNIMDEINFPLKANLFQADLSQTIC